MKQEVSGITQSRFYSPAFNAAIFDGPFKIYFAQYQESAALNIYFQVQKKLDGLLEGAKNLFSLHARSIFIMVYPTPDTFELSFDGDRASPLKLERHGDELVLGINGPGSSESIETIVSMVEREIDLLKSQPTPGPGLEAVL